jgi:hypothetical protein
MQPLDVKWSPGTFDDRYSPTTTADDDTDRNVILICATGLPAATGLQFRMTAIYEWVPFISLGIVNDSTQVKSSVCDKECILRELKRKDINWWWSLGRKTLKVASAVATSAATAGLPGVMGTVMNFIK